MTMLAGLALLGTLLLCLQSAFNDTPSNAPYQKAALITLLIGLSNITFLSVNAIM
ncbi:MAG: benzoate membrane transport protein [Candidatus Endobugula sp.]|jgi:benzoate membrane transport protein